MHTLLRFFACTLLSLWATSHASEPVRPKILWLVTEDNSTCLVCTDSHSPRTVWVSLFRTSNRRTGSIARHRQQVWVKLHGLAWELPLKESVSPTVDAEQKQNSCSSLGLSKRSKTPQLPHSVALIPMVCGLLENETETRLREIVARFHLDRIAGSHRHHLDPCRHAAARSL